MRRVCFLLFFICSLQGVAQIVNSRAIWNYNDLKESYQLGSLEHTAFKSVFLDSANYTSYFRVNRSDEVRVDPILELNYGRQNSDDEDILGYSVGGDIQVFEKKWRGGFTYFRRNSEYMSYQKAFILENRVVPSMNVASGRNMFSSDYFSGFLNYRANSIFSFELGYGRNFIGDGYRSMLLSDAGNASPYVKVTTQFWKIQYTNLFSSHQNIYNVEGEESLYKKKYSATHYLDWRATKWLSIGLFETIIWQAKEANYTRGFDPTYANPVIFYRPVEFSVGSSDNALVGTNIKITPFKNHVFYSQLLFDEFLLEELKADFNQFRNPDQEIRSGWWANKYAIQLGWTAFDFLQVEGLQTRLEFNLVRPYTYAHGSSTQSYSNYNISLAHPLGANFHELVSIINYKKENWLFKVQYNQARQGLSTAWENFGENLQLSNTARSREYENSLTQGLAVQNKYFEASASYLLLENWNTTLGLGFIWREQKSGEQIAVNKMTFIRLKSNLYNQYFDY